MLHHMAAAQTLLTAAGLTAYQLDVTDPHPPYPYALLWATTGTPHADTLSGCDTSLHDTLWVTLTDDSTDNLLHTIARARGVLVRARLVVPGWRVEPLRLVDSQPMGPDRQLTIPGTGRHPVYAVDGYRIVSQKES